MPTLVKSRPRSQHGTWIELRAGHLASNLKALQNAAGAGTEILAVVKANAYGHGLIETARALDGKVAYLGVSLLEDALDIKESGIKTPVFLFGSLASHEIPMAITEEITLSISSLQKAEEIAQVCRILKQKIPVHIKVDTGMGRLGIPLKQAEQTLLKIAGLEELLLEGIYTHLPNAESDGGFAHAQIESFSRLVRTLEGHGIRFAYRHAANSSGIVTCSFPELNMVRPGLFLYGIYPDEKLEERIHVDPVLSLKSRIIMLKHLEAGETVGYGRTFVAPKPTLIATLPIGYAQGYPWQASSKACVLYRGKRHPVAGRVSMDYLCVDLGSSEAHVGEEVTLIGSDSDQVISAEDLARVTGTIPYEIVTRLAGHLPRVVV